MWWSIQQAEGGPLHSPNADKPGPQTCFYYPDQCIRVRNQSHVKPAGRRPATAPSDVLEQKIVTMRAELCHSEKECLVWAIQSLQVYLYGQEFTNQSDHHALPWLDRIKDKNARVTRWRLMLQSYKYTVQHKPGKENTNANALSRAWMCITLRNLSLWETLSDVYVDKNTAIFVGKRKGMSRLPVMLQWHHVTERACFPFFFWEKY